MEVEPDGKFPSLKCAVDAVRANGATFRTVRALNLRSICTSSKMATVEGVNAFLAQRLEKAKENLEDVEQNIRKLTGGDSTERR